MTIIPRTRNTALAILGALAATLLLAPGAPASAQTTIGPETRLPLPRYVSLKTDRVNLREGPSTSHSTRWVYQRAGLPVEIIAEFSNWRRIRDSEGADGWVWHSLLSGRRTAMVAPWDAQDRKVIDLYDRPEDSAAIIARVQSGVVGSLATCSREWCRIAVRSGERGEITGFVPQEQLWGVYPDETLD